MEHLVAAQFPSQADCNPYIHLLKTALSRWGIGGHEHELFVDGIGLPLPILDQNWLRRHQGRVNLLHFHWLQKLYRADSPAEAEVKYRQLEDFLRLARKLDYRIAYTFHNLVPHEGMGPAMDLQVRRLIIEQADILTCFSQRQRERLQEIFGPLPLTVMPHPNYCDYYPNTVSASESRRRLGLPQEVRLFTYMGLIRPYKELNNLIRQFEALQAPDVHLLLAGVPMDQTIQRQVEAFVAAHPRTHCHLRWIADEEIQLFVNASDALVLPYRKCWTSGAIMLAYSFGKPVITADPLMLDEPAGMGFFYPEDKDGSGLRGALEQAASSRELGQMGERCLSYAQDHSWGRFSRQLALAYLSACGKPPKAILSTVGVKGTQ